ncbi:hypothetical protein N7501_001464 [Penicillium viridicatum]|nr:hypothetical protein N7501_001464 [Penicillium viridicatum]
MTKRRKGEPRHFHPLIYELGDEHPVITALVDQRHTLFLTLSSTAVSSAAGGRLRPRMSRPLKSVGW